MFKKIIIILFLLIPIISCGKKGDPVYQDKTGLNNWKINGSNIVYKNWLLKYIKKFNVL